MKTLKETKILGFPLWMFLILAALMMVMAANDWMLTNMVGALAFAMIIGTLLGFLAARFGGIVDDAVNCGIDFTASWPVPSIPSISSVRAPRKP